MEVLSKTSIILAVDPNTKEWLQGLAWFATACGVVVAAGSFIAAAGSVIVAIWKLLSDAHASREQRERDLRWRQAEAGKKLNDAMMADAESWAAMRMLDFSGRKFQLPSTASSTTVTVTHSDLSTVLNSSTTVTDDKGVYIRDCFDRLFYYLATLEHYISSKLIRYEDVAFPIEYYVPLLANFKSEAESYLVKYQLVRAQAFLSRFQAWKTPKSP